MRVVDVSSGVEVLLYVIVFVFTMGLSPLVKDLSEAGRVMAVIVLMVVSMFLFLVDWLFTIVLWASFLAGLFMDEWL